MEVNNWVLKSHIERISFKDFSIQEILKKNKIPLSNLETSIDWDNLEIKFSFFYDFINNENEIKNRLHSSLLSNYNTILIDIGEYPCFEIDTNTFINNWEDFVSSNGNCGIVISTLDTKFFMEFTDDRSFELFSNFEI